jgi:cobalamin biosynthesis Mg chelatase CobN
VLALLALAVFPVFAHAGGIPEYEVENETELPESHTTVKPKSHGGQHHASQTEPEAHSSAVETEKGSKPKPESSQEPESESTATGGGGGGGKGPNGNGGHHSGGNKSNAKPESNVSGAKKVATTQSGKPASSSSGGSSPLVPILIAIAVLAAISIGVVLYRQRKGDSGPGSDRRVSSPNAS